MAEWELIEAKYRGISFMTTRGRASGDPGEELPSHAGVISTTENFGKRLQVSRLPGVRGAHVLDRQSIEERISVRCIFWGPNYRARWLAFKAQALLADGAADLEHPIEGTIFCQFHRGRSTSTHRMANAIDVQLDFIEDGTRDEVLVEPLTVREAQAAVEKTSLDQLVSMFNTVTTVNRAIKKGRLAIDAGVAGIRERGVFSFITDATGTALSAGSIGALGFLGPQALGLYQRGAAAEAERAEVVEARNGTSV